MALPFPNSFMSGTAPGYQEGTMVRCLQGVMAAAFRD
jgi:hypothetical protein